MASEAGICNMGFVLIGVDVIESLSEDSDRADVANIFYEDTRDAVLRAHPWGFALTEAELAQASGSPEFGDYTYHFTLPTSPKCLRVLEVEEDYPGQIPYSIKGRKLLCDESTIKIGYIAQITNTGLFDALFTDCLAARLASTFAMALTREKKLVDLAWKLYEMKLQEAKTVDGQESVKKQIYNDTLTTAVR